MRTQYTVIYKNDRSDQGKCETLDNTYRVPPETPELFSNLIFLTAWSFLFFTGIAWILQLALFGEKIVSVHTPVVFFSFFLALLIISKGRVLREPLSAAWGGLFFLSFFSAVVSIVTDQRQALDLRGALLLAVTPILYYLLVAMVATTKIRLSQGLANNTFILLGFISVCVAMYQSVNGYSGFFLDYMRTVGSGNYYFFGLTRPISIFSQIGPYGFFIAFLAGATLWLIVLGRTALIKIFYTLLFIMLAALEYLTFSRSGYLCFILICLFVTSFHFSRKLSVITPILTFFLGLTLYFGAPAISDIGRTFVNHIASDHSVYVRYEEALIYLKILFENPYSAIFGPGLKASELINNGVYIDNQYLTIAITSGLLGLLIYVFAIALLWLKLFSLARNDPTPLRVAIAAFFATWPCVGFFAVDNSYLVLAILGLALAPMGHAINIRGGRWALM